jgi:hypothetical protein
MRADNSRHLVEAARRRSEQAAARARQALAEMQDAGQPFTITALAARAGVSRAWLYTQAEIRGQISALHHTTPARASRSAVTPASDASLRQRLTLALQRIRKLNDDNQRLRDQIAALHGQLRAARLANGRVADTVHDATSQVGEPNGQNDRR